MPKTKTELATRALGILGKLEAGQDPAPEDLALVEVVIDPLVSYLGLVDVIYVGDPDMIDDAAFLPLAARVALEVAADFGLPAPDEDTKRNAERPLRRLSWSGPNYTTLKVQTF